MRMHKPLVHLFLLLCVMLTIGPFLWLVLTAMKTLPETIMLPPVLFPEKWQWRNFIRIFETMPFLTFYYNSLLATLFTVAGQVAICAMAAYAFARLSFPGRDVVFLVCLSILMVPGQMLLIPQFMIVQKLGLLNSIGGLVIPNLFSVYGAFLLRQFFQSLPKELEEAAVVDGLNYFQVFWRVMLPLVKPGLVAFGVIVMLWSWNSLLWPLIVNTSESKMTVPVGLASLSGRTGTDYPLLMTAAILGIVPLLAIFIVFQRQFIASVALTGVKG